MPILNFTPIDDLWEPVEKPFVDAFETVCRSTPHKAYASIIAKAALAMIEAYGIVHWNHVWEEKTANASLARELLRRAFPFSTLFSRKELTWFLTRPSAPLHGV
jgi:hypothetical protein